MRKRTILTLVLGTVILFIWNAISWMALPFHSNTLNNIPEGAMEVDALKSNMTKSGIYHYPGLPKDNSPEAMKVITEQLEAGPRITFMVYKSGPSEFFDPMLFVVSLLLNFLTVAACFFVVSRFQDRSLSTVLSGTIVIGLLIGIVSDFSQMNWFMFPADYTLVNVFDHLIAFTLLGFLFGKYSFKELQEA